MYQKVSQLLMYSKTDEDNLLYKFADIFRKFDNKAYDNIELVREINIQIKRLLEIATDYGFDGNLWHNYLTFFIIMNENPFSLICEKEGAREGSVNVFAQNDFKIIKQLFEYDFENIENALNISCFSLISNYKSIQKNNLMYNKNVSEKVQKLSKKLESSKDEKDFFDIVTKFYKDYGVGMFGLNKAFRIDKTTQGSIDFKPINNMDEIILDDLIGYDMQKQELIENTSAFVKGKKANNVLLYGDSGTGKSSSIKAIVNQFYDKGLRMIEIYKHQFEDLSEIISIIKKRNYKFIIYMDDLSFEEHEIEYKFLKAVIEGGVETKPDNILIYATSNRRHLIRETWSDKADEMNIDDIHHSDTMEEKLSLVSRFGITINFSKPNVDKYIDIVIGLAKRANLKIPQDMLILEAKKWEMWHGGMSGRTAQQFVNYMLYHYDEK